MQKEEAFKKIIVEILDLFEEILEDPEIQQYIPVKYKPLIAMTLKVIRLVVEALD